MIVKRPSIFIYANNPDKDCLRQLCAGIEEEGVHYEVYEKDYADVDTLAHVAASDSMLGSGIGICRNSVALQIKGIAKGKNVEFYEIPTLTECRKLGSNSARVIMTMPLNN